MMKHLFLALSVCVLTCLLAMPAEAQLHELPEVTVSGLPAASAVGRATFIVTDGASATDCSTGGGSSYVQCYSTGSAWTPLSGGSGGSGAFTDDSDPVVLNTTTKDVHIGGDAGTLVGKLELVGDADQPQLVVQCFSTQTDDCVIFQNSAGVQFFAVAANGTVSASSFIQAASNLSTVVSGGNATNDGSNVILHGSTHATLANVIRWRTGTTDRMRLLANGNLGLGGQTSPSEALDVTGNGTFSGTLAASNLSGTNTGDNDTNLTQEEVEDFVGAMVTGNTETNITVTYQDGDGTLDFVVTGGSFTTLDADYGDETITSDFDFGGGTVQIPNSTSLPGTCETGDQYMDTDATSGQRLFLCESANTWALQGDGTGGGSPLDTQVDGASQAADTQIYDWASADFTLTESPANDFDITILDSGIDHDATTNFLAAEHVDWAGASAGTIHATNYVDNDTQLSQEQVEDFAGGMWTGNTETGATVTYQDADGTIDITTDVTLTGAETLTNKTINTASNTITVVEADISDLSHTTDTNLTQEEVEDFAGPLFATGGTKTGITFTYQDTTGDVDVDVDHDAATNFVAGEHFDLTDKASLEAELSDAANLAEADGDAYTGVHDFSAATSLEIPNGTSPSVSEGQFALDTDDFCAVLGTSGGSMSFCENQQVTVDADNHTVTAADNLTILHFTAASPTVTVPTGLQPGNGTMAFAVVCASPCTGITFAGAATITGATPDETGDAAFLYESATDAYQSLGYEADDDTGGAPATADISDVSVTQTELAELETIGATTISANQWAALGGIAETLTSTELNLLDGLTVLGDGNTGDVTLAGTPDYLTISGQIITRGTIDIGDDTNLAVTAPIVLTGDNVSLDLTANVAITGDWDFGSGGLEIENGTTPPACTVGQLYLDTNATSGQQLMGCEGGTFVVQGDGGGAEVNNLETADPPNVLANEIYIGNGAASGVWTVLSGDVSNAAGVVTVNDVQTATANTESADNSTTQVATTAFVQQEIDNEEKQWSITVDYPDAAEDISLAFTNQAVTITEVRAVIIGSSTPSVTYTVRHGTDRSAAGAELVTSGDAVTSTTTGDAGPAFNDATIVADSFVWLETTAQSGTVDQLHVTVFYTVD